MDILIGILLGVIIGSVAICFYALGLSHGRAVKDGTEVKFEPHRPFVKAVKVVRHVKEKKETEKKQDEFTKQVNELFAYDGRQRKRVGNG